MNAAGVFRAAIAVGLLLTMVVVPLGAYVRLTDAGLGCPDWPGCYGHWTVPVEGAAGIDPAKAWNEMIHRYAAATLGLAALVAGFAAWRARRHRGAATALVLLVLLQGALGRWTVTLKLLPTVVMAHLLGGMAILLLFWWLFLSQRRMAPLAVPGGVRQLAGAALLVTVMQVMLGGWTSANYAALICPDFPTCQGQWWPEADFTGLVTNHPVGPNYEGGLLGPEQRTAIHLSHRIGAVAVLLAAGTLGWRLWRFGGRARTAGGAVLVALALQWGLGVTNVLALLPLPVAVAHNAGAALLLMTLLWCLRRLEAVPQSSPQLATVGGGA